MKHFGHPQHLAQELAQSQRPVVVRVVESRGNGCPRVRSDEGIEGFLRLGSGYAPKVGQRVKAVLVSLNPINFELCEDPDVQ